METISGDEYWATVVDGKLVINLPNFMAYEEADARLDEFKEDLDDEPANVILLQDCKLVEVDD